MSVTGTVKRVTIDGITFNVLADSNFSQNHSKFENEGVATSGGSMQKKTARVQMVSGVSIATDEDEDQTLIELADRADEYPMSYETAAGRVYRTTGFIKYDNRETETGTAKIELVSTIAEGWELF